ncbi:MAG: hypothetical protein IKW71_00680 [Elusimicrobiaceae bacterium]|nr:hypothetical protein [Elusimicrobiaceae bacterium]
MIEIGKNFFWGLSNARRSAQQEKNNYTQRALQTQQTAEALQAQYEEQLNYLFRSASEKTQLAYSNARAQLAATQAKRVAHGLAQESASARDEKQTALLQQAQMHQQTQDALQATASQKTRNFQEKWRELGRQIANYRKQAKRKGRLGSFGRAILSLFK